MNVFDTPPCLLHGLDMPIQTALVPSGLVLVDHALTRHVVNHGHGSLIGQNRVVLVATVNRLDYVFDVRAKHGTLTGITLAVRFRLTSAFFRLC